MKRSVAILGSTPPFVRWAIEHPCPLRTIDTVSLADQTFRQLRGLRELSIGMKEDRVFEGVCIHPEASATQPERARGFVDREVLDAFGDAEEVSDCCRLCPANALRASRPGIWAGCYGWIPADLDFDFEMTLRGQSSSSAPVAGDESAIQAESGQSRPGMVELFEDAFDRLAEADSRFSENVEALFPTTTTPRWYGVWQSPQLTPKQVEVLNRLFGVMVSDWDSSNSSPSPPRHLVQFHHALQSCEEHGLVMHVELVPAGDSDGSTWTVRAHCPNCKFEQASSSEHQQHCLVCQRFGNPHGQLKSKVLGLRPYALLSLFLGEQKTVELLKRYEAKK